MATCPNCGNRLGCGCQKRTLANGSQGCVNCVGKTTPTAPTKSNKAPGITSLKKSKTTDENITSQLNVWGEDRYKNLQKYIKK